MFDPFGDFQTAGYLRNVERLKDSRRIKLQEHFFFETRLEDALSQLKRRRGPLDYRDLQRVHHTLFCDFYPWAASDKQAYLGALTHELGKPRDRALDGYLSGLLVESRPRDDWVEHFKSIPGLSGLDGTEEHLEYRADDADALARYEEIRRSRMTP